MTDNTTRGETMTTETAQADACPRCEVGTVSQQTWTSDGRTIHGGMECEDCGWTETDGQPCDTAETPARVAADVGMTWETWTDREITDWARSVEAAYEARFYTPAKSTEEA